MTYHLLVHNEYHEEAYCVHTFLLRSVWLKNRLQLKECNHHSNVNAHGCMVNGIQIPEVGVYAENQGNEA